MGRERGVARRAAVLVVAATALAPLRSWADAPLGRAPPFTNVSRGVVAGLGVGTSMAGDSLLGALGAEWAAIRVSGDPRWLWQWDALAEAQGGDLANAIPYRHLWGGQAAGYVEVGQRFHPARAWSPYAGARVAGDLYLRATPGVSLSALDTVNDMDGVGGFGASAGPRLDGGVSWLAHGRSLLLVGFAQEWLTTPGADAPGAAFTDGGIAARLDAAGAYTFTLEGLWGFALARTDPALGWTDEAQHVGMAAAARAIFGRGMWLTAALELDRRTDHTSYGNGGSYDVAGAPTFALTLAYGFPLGAQR